MTRRADQKVERSRLTGYQTWKFTVQLKVANLAADPVDVEVRERLPVSEIADLKVHPPTAAPPVDVGPDADGMCTWKLALEPGAVRTLQLAYTVEAPASVRLPWA